MIGILIYDDNDNSLPYEVEVKEVYNEKAGKIIPFYYTLKIKTPTIFNIKIEKVNYYPFKSVLNLFNYASDKQFSVHDETFVHIDLDRFPLLSTVKNNGITLAWGQYPYDLDAYLTNPTGEKTYYNNRETYFSIVDIDDKMSYGPETISINYWTDINANYYDDNKINTLFKYDVNWFKNGNEETNKDITVNSLGASVHFFIDPTNTETIIYPPDLDTQNRKGQNWHVFELDILSTYDRFPLNENDYIISKYVNDDAIADPSYYIINEEWISLNEYYYNILKNYNFVFKIVDDKNNDLSKYFLVNSINHKYKYSNNSNEYYSFFYVTPNKDESYCIIKNSKNPDVNGNYFYNDKQYEGRNVFYNGKYYLYYRSSRWRIGKELSNSSYEYTNQTYYELSGSFTNEKDSSDICKISFNNPYINYSESNAFDDYNQTFINDANLKINAYINEEHKELNLIYQTINFSSLQYEDYRYNFINDNGYEDYTWVGKRKSFLSERLFSGKMIPFVMYDLNNKIINDVKYRWNYNERRLYIEVLNRKTKLKEVKTIEYILGFSTNIQRSQLINKNGYECKSKLSNLSWYFYLDRINLSKNVKSKEISDDEMHFTGFFTFKNENTNIMLSRPKLFEIHAVPEKENIKNISLNKDMLYENEILVNVQNFTIIDGHSLINYDDLRISKVEGDEIPRELYDELMVNQLLEKKVNLIKVLNKENNEISITKYEWSNDGLLISSDENISDEDVTLYFKYNYFIINKFSTLGYENIKENEEIYPNVYISIDDVRMNTKDYMFTWHPQDLRLFLKDDFDENKTYEIEIVDNLKMHKFNYYKLNYFDKKLTVNFNIRNYDDYIVNEDGSEILIENSRQKINNLNFNFNERDVRRKDDTYTLKVAKAEPSDSYYSNHSISTYSYDLSENNIKCDWDYIASFDTVYKHNNYFEYISLYSDSNTKPTHVSKENNETITYELLYPLTNYYGWFIDSKKSDKSFTYFMNLDEIKEIILEREGENGLLNTLKNYIYGDAYTGFCRNETNSLRCRLINKNSILSSDLIYNYSLKYEYRDNESGGTQIDGCRRYERPVVDYGWLVPCYKEEYTNFYSFMFKQKFNGDRTPPDDDWGYDRGVRNAVVPGMYKMELYYNDNSTNPICVYDNIDLTKENEKLRNTYNVKHEFPFVNFTGYILNKHTGNKEWRSGVQLRLTSKTDTSSQIPGLNGMGNSIPGQYIYTFGNFYGCDEYYESDNNENSYDGYGYGRVNNEFQFLFQGLDFNYYYTWYEHSLIPKYEKYLYSSYSGYYYYAVGSNICAESALPSGIYKLELRYRKDNISDELFKDPSVPDNEKYDIFYEEDNFELSKERESEGLLYNYVIESPFIDFNGYLYENISGPENVDILYGNEDQTQYQFISIISGGNWHVELENINDPNKSRIFSFKGSGDDGYYYYGREDFKFRGFGRIKYDYDDMSDNRDYFSKGLLSGTYNLIVRYKGKEIKKIKNILINKENENLGKFDNVKINVGNIFTNISGHIVDSKFNDFVIDSQMINVKEEEFTGDINDSQFLDRPEGSDYGWLFDYYYYGSFNYNGRRSYKYEFNDLKRIGQYAIGVWDDYHDYYGLEWFKNPLKIKGIVKGKSLNDLEGKSGFDYTKYKFDDYNKVSGTNIFIEANSGEGSHKTFDLLSLKDVNDSSKNLTYDIYLKYANTKFPYHIYYLKNGERYELKVPIDLSLSENYDPNDEEHIKLENGNISGLININWNHIPVWYSYYSSYYLHGYTNSLSGYNELLKSGMYKFDISISNTSFDLFRNNELEISSSKYEIERQIDINSKNFTDFKTIILTKYYSMDENDAKYQVVKLDSSNMFKTTLEYSTNGNDWFKYYDFDSYSKNTEEEELVDHICSGEVLAISGWENLDTMTPSSLPIQYSSTLTIFDQLYKDLYIRFNNISLYGMTCEIAGIYDDIDLNGIVREKSLINEIIPYFEDEEGNSSNVSGHISALFDDYYYYEYNHLKRHLISGDFKRENNLLDENNSFAVSSLINYKSDIKILELKYLKVSIKGEILANDGSSINAFGTEILMQIFKYDIETKNETLIQEQYCLGNKFNLTNIETGFYKFRFFIGNIEIYEKERNKIHTFNYNENYYNIKLEKHFPSLSGNVLFKGFDDSSISESDTIISINNEDIAYYYPEVIGLYVLTNNPKNKIDRIFKHKTKDIYILATSDRLNDYYGSVSWIITKFDHRISSSELNKDLNNLDSFFASYNNMNDDPIESFKYSMYYYATGHYDSDEIEGWWSGDIYIGENNSGINYIDKTSSGVYFPAIDYVHLDVINNNLNDYSYYGFAYEKHENDKAQYFYQNTGMNDAVNYDYSKFYLDSVLEGNYKIKYFIFPDGPYQYYHWSHYGYTDARSNYIDFSNSSNETAKSLYSNIMNILSGNASSNEIKISTNDFWNMINSVNCDQLKEQFFKSDKLRIFRIQMNYSFHNKSSNNTKHCFSLIKFEDEFPSGGLYNNLSDTKYIKLKINSSLSGIVPKQNTTNISWDWDTFNLRHLILSWADLMAEEDITISRNSKTISTKYFDYMYTYETNLRCSGYNSNLHNNQNVHSKIFENDKLITSGRFSGSNKTKTYYGLKTTTPYYCTYNRSDFILGDINVPYIYGRINYVDIECNKLYTISGKLLNRSIEKCKQLPNIDQIYDTNDLTIKNTHRIDYRLMYRGGSDETLNQEIGTYYTGEYVEYGHNSWSDKYSFDSLLSGKYDIRYRARSWYDEHIYFNGNRSNWDNNSNEEEYSLTGFEFKNDNYNITKNIEIPCFNFTVTLEIIDNKDGRKMRYIPLSTILLSRNQKSIDSSDKFDKVFTGVYGENNYSSPNYNDYQVFNVKSGYYDSINIKCTISGMQISETYEKTVINEDRVFRVYGNCEVTNIKIKVLKNGNLQPNTPVFIFDENKNLKNIVYTNQSGNITAPLKNIPYYFKAISQKHEFIYQKKIDNTIKEIELSY